MRIKYDAEIADIFKTFTETLCNIRERNTRNVEQTRKDYEDQLHEAIVAVQAAGHEISSSSNWEDIIFSPKEELLVSHDLNIALARDRMNQIADSLTAQQNAMFIYATGMFEKFISDIVHIAVRKSSSAKKLYQDKFIDFANNYYKRFNSEAHQKEIGDTAKMLNSYHDMIAVEGGFLSIILYMFDNDKQLVKNQYFKTNLNLYKENKERRNLLIHRGSIADRQYYQGLKRARINQWEKLLSERVFVPMGLNESKYSLDFPELSLDFRWILFGLSLDSLWIFVGFALDFLWILFGFSLDSLWIFIGFSLGFRWILVGVSLDSLWIVVGFSLGFRWILFRFSLD